MEKSQGRGTARRVVPGLSLPLLSLLVLICAAQEAVDAAQHQVGGTGVSWSVPSRSNVDYTDWAKTQTFVVGDTLFFNYSKEHHNVVQVTEANYNNCSAVNPIHLWNDGATIVQLNQTGTFYYICSFPGHCEQEQKFAALVKDASSSSSALSALSHLCFLLALSLISIVLLLP